MYKASVVSISVKDYVFEFDESVSGMMHTAEPYCKVSRSILDKLDEKNLSSGMTTKENVKRYAVSCALFSSNKIAIKIAIGTQDELEMFKNDFPVCTFYAANANNVVAKPLLCLIRCKNETFGEFLCTYRYKIYIETTKDSSYLVFLHCATCNDNIVGLEEIGRHFYEFFKKYRSNFEE